MAKNKGKGGRSASKTQKHYATCPSCKSRQEVERIVAFSPAKRKYWGCKTCGAVCSGPIEHT